MQNQGQEVGQVQGQNEVEKPGNSASSERSVEPEFVGSIWQHPYLIYVYLTAVIFGGMIFIGWLALDQGWIPSRG